MDGSASASQGFVAGIVSFLPPCVCRRCQKYISSIAGQAESVPPLDARRRIAVLMLTAFFVLGFGAVFVPLGASTKAIGRLLLRYRYEANIVGGVIVIVFGLVIVGLLRRVTRFQRDLRLRPRPVSASPATAFVLGVALRLRTRRRASG